MISSLYLYLCIFIHFRLRPWIDIESEGMIQVVETDLLALKAETLGKIMDAEVKMDSDRCLIQKKRTAEAQKSSQVCVRWSLDLSLTISPFTDSGEAINEAEVFLLPEELPIFTLSLLQHHILFPINYSQQVSMERGMYCIRITSKETPEDFAERLSDALRALEK